MSQPLLDVKDLSVSFAITQNKKWPWSETPMLRAVTGVSFQLEAGKTLGIVGESGCGKSTLARAIIGLTPIESGSVHFMGEDITHLKKSDRDHIRKDMQMIFQDPLSSLNPRMTIGDIVAEPLRKFHPEMSKHDRMNKVRSILDRVGILANNVNRYPHEFSGGQCQRIGIARALIMQPKLLICDEPVSALDVSVQAQVVNLLKEIQDEMGLALVFVAHDLGVVRHVSDEIFVMYLGQAMEHREGKPLIDHPHHPYTAALLSAVPVPDPDVHIEPEILIGDLPSPLNLPKGCAFSTRCKYAQAKCKDERPPLTDLKTGGKIACFYPLD